MVFSKFFLRLEGRLLNGTLFRIYKKRNIVRIATQRSLSTTHPIAETLPMNNLIHAARLIPISEPEMTFSVNAVTLDAPERGLPLQMRITAPVAEAASRSFCCLTVTGRRSTFHRRMGYGPLANFCAEQGFCVIQPTHASSKVAGLPADAEGGPLFWRSRVADMTLILDRLNEIEAQVPWLAGRLDPEKVAAVGHSMGGQTVGMLLGARLTDPQDDTGCHCDCHLSNLCITVGGAACRAGQWRKDLSDYAAKHYTAPYPIPDFSSMTTRTLVVMGDADENPHITVRGADWHADPYHLSPGAMCFCIDRRQA